MTIREALRSAAERLELHLVSNARLTAEVLLAHVLSVEREFLYAHDEQVLRDAELESLESLLYDRVSGIPLQYIVGRQEFYGRPFHVTPAVLIPRPETEHIIEFVLEIRAMRGQTPRCRIMDVGTGSGCIAATLALEIPDSEVFAGDISERALHIARENALALNARVGFVCMDLLDAITGPFDLIVSNPPYVPQGDFSRLQREVRDHEPHIALFSLDELDIYKRLVAASYGRLRPGGHLVMEIGFGMEDRVSELLEDGWEKLPAKADLQGIPRTVAARKI